MKKIRLITLFSLFVFFARPAISCTTFIISGKYTTDGKPLLFKNRDTETMDNALVLFKDGKYKYLGEVNAEKDRWKNSVWGGYNEAGFAIINSAAYVNNLGDTSRVKGHDGMVIKKALMYCSSLKDFENLLDTLPKPMGVNSNFGVIDAHGGAAYYETGNYRYVKYDANDPMVAPRGILVRTNHSMSADLTEGFGFNRYDNAWGILNQAWEENKLTPQYLFKTIPRSLYHPRTRTDLSVNIPERRDVPDFRFFIDYIPRYQTSSSFMIVGAKDEKHIEETMMWTILGFPLTSIAIPAWLSAGEIPKSLQMNEKYKAPICNAALKFKEECFPITMDKGFNYINLSVVLNQEGTGYMQLLQPVEKEIFERANLLIIDLDKDVKSKNDILAFYAWIDKYIEEYYKNKLDYDLFDNQR